MSPLHFLLCLASTFGTFTGAGGQQQQASHAGGRHTYRRLQANQASQQYVQKALQQFYTNRELEASLRDYARRCQSIAKLSSIGHSVQGTPLWVLEISNNPGKTEAKPNFKYVGNMHGDETSGRQLLLALAEWLCANHQTDALAKQMVQQMHLFLVPSMNPDGYAAGARGNANYVDLNRDFPDPLTNPSMQPSGLEQPETQAVMNWTLAKGFVAAANMHEGAVVANYPYDGSSSGFPIYNATSDDMTFMFLARTYSQRNERMWRSSTFPDGITNGAAWYSINGGMQDWDYLVAGCFELTLELWDVKGGAPLQQLFQENLQSLLHFALTASLGGVRGTVQKRVNGKLQPMVANITVKGSPLIVTQSKPRFGDFYRPLVPGKHSLLINAAGYPPKTISVTVPSGGKGSVKNVVF